MEQLKRPSEMPERMLDLGPGWRVSRVEHSREDREFLVHVEQSGRRVARCPVCDRPCKVHDRRRREWRSLKTHGHGTRIVCEVPRVKCPEHGVRTMRVPWAEERKGYTLALEIDVLDRLLGGRTIAQTCRETGLSWTSVDGIMQRAVKRGLARRKPELVRRLAVDEVASRKGHSYMTVVLNAQAGHVLAVEEGRDAASLRTFYEGLSAEQLEAIDVVSMDMWKAFIKATEECVPDAHSKIAFDPYHVIAHANDAVARTRRQENAERLRVEDETLKGMRFELLAGAEKLSRKTYSKLLALFRKGVLRTARAWAMKEELRQLWNYRSRAWARKRWMRWIGWAQRCRIEPMRKVGRMVRDHLWGILNAVVLDTSNAMAESANSRIRLLKIRSHGFRNMERFKAAIYFYFGGLDLYPDRPNPCGCSLPP